MSNRPEDLPESVFFRVTLPTTSEQLQINDGFQQLTMANQANIRIFDPARISIQEELPILPGIEELQAKETAFVTAVQEEMLTRLGLPSSDLRLFGEQVLFKTGEGEDGRMSAVWNLKRGTDLPDVPTLLEYKRDEAGEVSLVKVSMMSYDTAKGYIDASELPMLEQHFKVRYGEPAPGNLTVDDLRLLFSFARKMDGHVDLASFDTTVRSDEEAQVIRYPDPIGDIAKIVAESAGVDEAVAKSGARRFAGRVAAAAAIVIVAPALVALASQMIEYEKAKPEELKGYERVDLDEGTDKVGQEVIDAVRRLTLPVPAGAAAAYSPTSTEVSTVDSSTVIVIQVRPEVGEVEMSVEVPTEVSTVQETATLVVDVPTDDAEELVDGRSTLDLVGLKDTISAEEAGFKRLATKYATYTYNDGKLSIQPTQEGLSAYDSSQQISDVDQARSALEYFKLLTQGAELDITGE